MKSIFKKDRKKEKAKSISNATTITIKKVDQVWELPQKEITEKKQIETVEKTENNTVVAVESTKMEVEDKTPITDLVEKEKEKTSKKKIKADPKSLAKAEKKTEKKAKKQERKLNKQELRNQKREKSFFWKKYRALKRGIVHLCLDFQDFCGEIIESYDISYKKTNKRYHIFLRNKAFLTHSIKVHLDKYSKVYASYFFAALIISVGFVLIIDSVTCYAYTYNGRLLGYVKNQSDVVDVLGMVEDGLSDEHGRDIQINVGENIEFEETTVFDKEVDTPHVILNTLTYMQDIEASAYGIYIEGILITKVENKDIAEDVLESVKDYYAPEKEGVTYDEVAFSEEVVIEELQSKLGDISNEESAVSQIISAEKKGESYVVQPAETFVGIASKLEMTQEELLAINPDVEKDPETDTYIVTEGQRLISALASPVLTVTAKANVNYQVEVDFEETKNNTSNLYQGETVVRTPGVVGINELVADITYVNGVEVSRNVISETVIREPVTQVVDYGTSPTPPAVASGNFQLPTYGYVISSPYGARWGGFHSGIDLSAGMGTAIYAADGGTVTSAGWQGSYGYAIDISHGNGLSTKYAHLSSISVSIGDAVFKGERIGGMGSTGVSSGSHLHFEIRVNGSHVNPSYYLSF